jgi:hypothetical protein
MIVVRFIDRPRFWPGKLFMRLLAPKEGVLEEELPEKEQPRVGG